MKLKDFLSYIADEEVRVELEIDECDDHEYLYESFWFSDYCADLDIAKYYNDYKVTGISFSTEFSESDIQIQISKK